MLNQSNESRSRSGISLISRRPSNLWTILAVAVMTIFLVGSTISWNRQNGATKQDPTAFVEGPTDEVHGEPKLNENLGFVKWILKKKRGKRWPSSKGFPCISPADSVLLVEAVYAKKSDQFLATEMKGRYKVVSKIRFRRWKAIAVTGPRRRLLFVFRGANTKTTQWRTIIGSIKQDKKKFNRWIARVTDEQAKRGYSAYAYVGQSGGGYLANKLKAKKSVWRISFNGYKCNGGRNKINLRSRDDWLTRKKDKNYLTLFYITGGHRIWVFEDLKKFTRGRDWKKVDKVFEQWKRCRCPRCKSRS